jgi:predicted RNA-binding protein YlqC (UPF0109 family)
VHVGADGRAELREFLEMLVKAIVDEPDAVRIEMIAGETTLLFEITVAKANMGQLIGKQGRNIRAIRDLVLDCAGKNRLRVDIQVLDG